MAQKVFEHRGFMLDVCRHYMPVEDIKRLIRAAALCGMNRMHWHLTDDQGWRIEILKYPKLAQVGSARGRSHFGGVSGAEHNCGFYTQAEARDIVAFARGCGVEIIPEIELPGHASAMLAAYPEYGCRRPDGSVRRPSVVTAAGIYPDLLCAGSDAAIRFVEDILDEIVSIFPFPMVHIGGDEAPKLHWRRCPACQARMRSLGIETEDGLQRWLVLQVGDYLAQRGRETIVWNDVLAGGLLPSHFIVQQWLGDAPQTRAFLAAGGRVIRSDTDYCYFDYPYGAIDVRRLWEMPRVPDYARGYEDGLLGMECPLWTERVTNVDRAACLLFPRLAAAGLRMAGDDLTWEAFLARVKDAMGGVEALGLRGAPEAFWHMPPDAAAADRAADEACTVADGAAEYVRWEKTLVRIEQAERLMAAIRMPRAFALRVGDRLMAMNDGETAGDDGDGAGALGEQLLRAVANRAGGPWQGLPEDIWLATMGAFSRFVGEYHRSYGVYGYDRAFWTTRQAEARLFRIGELEYELARGEDGAAVIELHIPSDARLEPAALDASVEAARRFMAAYFPDWRNAPIGCESWLLSPALDGLLPESSNILMFQRAFDIVTVDPNDDSVLEWVFKLAAGQQASARLEALPEGTSLQRRMKAFMMNGGRIGAARGALKRAFHRERGE